MAQRGIGWAGYLLRFLAAVVLVFSTYNPSGYSYFHWARDSLPGIDPLVVFAGVILLIGWTVFLRATFRSLGAFGLLLAFAFFGTLIWLLVYWDLVPADNLKAIIYIVQVVLCGVLATGISWSHIRRRMTGQVDVDEIEGDV
ncbi:MAG: DUF6524 family protein [Gammaproteobacteria bacterium]|jgi:hypothetical protein